MGGGYAPLAYSAGAGISEESTHIIFDVGGAYDNGHKRTPPNQPDNPNGHDRHLQGRLYYRSAHRWFVGAGWRWGQLSTTNFTKGNAGPSIGGGYDLVSRSCESCRPTFSARLSVDWLMAGNDWQNGTHGPHFVITLPTPHEKGHWFFSDGVGIYRFHTTVTEPLNVPLTALQRSQRQFAAWAECGIAYRF
jgi:hypothetical protein